MRKPEIQSDSVTKLSQSDGSNFFASGLRQKVDQLMNILWAGGVNNPMDSIEQLSYLICPILGGGKPSPSGDAFRRLAVRWRACVPTVAPPIPFMSCTTTLSLPPSTASRSCGG